MVSQGQNLPTQKIASILFILDNKKWTNISPKEEKDKLRVPVINAIFWMQ